LTAKKEMEVEQVLHMNGGDGKTSYANHSLLQVSLSLSLNLVMKIKD
jgi:hypothetical protein